MAIHSYVVNRLRFNKVEPPQISTDGVNKQNIVNANANIPNQIMIFKLFMIQITQFLSSTNAQREAQKVPNCPIIIKESIIPIFFNSFSYKVLLRAYKHADIKTNKFPINQLPQFYFYSLLSLLLLLLNCQQLLKIISKETPKIDITPPMIYRVENFYYNKIQEKIIAQGTVNEESRLILVIFVYQYALIIKQSPQILNKLMIAKYLHQFKGILTRLQVFKIVATIVRRIQLRRAWVVGIFAPDCAINVEQTAVMVNNIDMNYPNTTAPNNGLPNMLLFFKLNFKKGCANLVQIHRQTLT
eukprot:TRINITY_DN10321_c0_g1_i2.p2 TRINITY_DN10321_c0_g1~~TRINITY_DN10321_c0_g1_i2.p2  ORF type:complete len:300 (-),score=6.36 TRINITY_DN10321_c0_g1_i2:133-1032(-)